MRRFLILVLLLISAVAHAEDYDQLKRQALAFAKEQNYSQAIALTKKAFLIRQDNASDYYNAACFAALGGDKDLAFLWLNLSFEKGMHNIEHVLSDADLNNLHEDLRWTSALKNARALIAEAEKNFNKPLQKTLLEIFDADQIDRRKANELTKKFGFDAPEVREIWQKIEANDLANTEKVKAIIAQHGWVGPDQVGRRASQTLFLVIQHADEETRRQFLPLLREAVKNKKAQPSDLALMEDRAAIEAGGKQIYGSQIMIVGAGSAKLQPLEDPDNVDRRRASVGLGPLADYLKNWDLVWDVEVYKKSQIESNALKKGLK